MAMDPELSALLTQTVSISSLTTRNAHGEKSYGTATSYAARQLQYKARVFTDTGEEVTVSSVVITVGGPFSPDIKVTLPDSTTRPVVRVHNAIDEKGDHHHARIYFQ